MTQPRIALIGAGQFGSRHLQALALCEQPLDLLLVDPSEASRKVAQERFESVQGSSGHSIAYLPDPAALPEVLDVVIIATSARHRRQVVEALLPRCRIDYLVLEKVLFQSAADCREMQTVLSGYETRVWVNAPRRMWRLYRGLKEALTGKPVRQIHFSTAGWGMACNTFHMLDLFSWLADSPLETLSARFLDPDPIPARRDGFYELTGMLTGQLASGARFTITDHREGKRPLKLLIETDDACFMLQEGKAEVTVLDGEAPEIEALSGIGEQFQSRLTNKLVESLLDQGTCALPTYDEAAAVHEIMLPVFAEVFNRNGLGEDGVCPIT
jgi:predicted dehydrogenase